MARALMTAPTALAGLSLFLVLWLLCTSFVPQLSTEALGLAWPFLWRTIIFAVITSAGQVILGLLAALTVLWLARSRASQLALITIFLLPYAIPAAVIGLIFRFALGAQSAWAEVMSPLLGVTPDFWLYRHAFEAAILASIWQFFPFAFLLSYLALRTISPTILRAAQLDGAPFLRMTYEIVLVRVWPVLAAIFALRLVFMLVKFDTPFVFTETIASGEDVATIELWRAIAGSTSPELSIIAWGLQLLAIAIALLYMRPRRAERA